jgi:hypothetical protein
MGGHLGCAAAASGRVLHVASIQQGRLFRLITSKAAVPLPAKSRQRTNPAERPLSVENSQNPSGTKRQVFSPRIT